MNGSNKEAAKAWIDEWHNLPEAEKALIRTTIKALDKNRIQAQAMAAQEAKIAEQVITIRHRDLLLERYKTIAEQRQAFLDRCNEAIKAQAFQLGRQDRELIQLRSRVKAAEAGDVATLRINNAFQHSEIMRLKAALAERETALALCRECNDNMRRTYDRQSAMIEALEAERAELQAKVAELEAALKAEKAENVKAHTECGTHYKATLRTRQRARLAEDMVAKLELELAERDAKIKALQNDIDRLKGIADHSNNLAQNRLEELAKLRRELAVARDATAKLEGKLAELQEAATWRAVSQVE